MSKLEKVYIFNSTHEHSSSYGKEGKSLDVYIYTCHDNYNLSSITNIS